jgi:hypothetical protein
MRFFPSVFTMKIPAYLWLMIAIMIVGGMLWTSREGFIPTVDTSQEDRTKALSDSSYRQETNNFSPTPADFGPILGTPGKDRVNIWQGVVV